MLAELRSGDRDVPDTVATPELERTN